MCFASDSIFGNNKTYFQWRLLCWAKRTCWWLRDSMRSSLNWPWQNPEINISGLHRCLRSWTQTVQLGRQLPTSYMSRNGPPTMSWMRLRSADRCFTPRWLHVLGQSSNQSEIHPKGDLIFRSRFPRSPNRTVPPSIHRNSPKGTTKAWTSASQGKIAASHTNVLSRRPTANQAPHWPMQQEMANSVPTQQ